MSEKKKQKRTFHFRELPAGLFRLTGRVLKPLFGSISYTPPAYMIRFWEKGAKEGETSRDRMRRYGKRILLTILILFGILILGVGALFGWYKRETSRPHDLRIDYSVSKILSAADPEKPVQPLKIQFRISAAPKEMTGKVLSGGITIKPDIPGQWKWEEIGSSGISAGPTLGNRRGNTV